MVEKIISKIAGKYPDNSMVHRAINLLSFSTGFNCFLGGIVAIVLQFESSTIFFQFLISFSSFLLYFYSKINKKLSDLLLFITVYTILIISVISWFQEGGIDGPIYGVAAGFFYMYLSISTNNFYSIIFPISYILTLLLILFLNYLHPDWVVYYTTKEQRYIDFVVNFFQTIIPVYIVYQSNQECYKYEQQLVEHKNQQLSIANSTKEKLFAIIGHDLRSPIASLDSLFVMLKDGRISPSQMQQQLLLIQNKTGQIRDLLDNLLYWAVSQMDQIETQPKQLALLPIIDQELSMLREQADYKQLSINCSISKATTFYADAEQSRVILRNLLTNAIKYCKENGTVNIASVNEKQTITITISNTGEWAEEGVDKINPKRKGFGLALSKDFAERNKGSLHIDKTANGEAMVRWITLLPPPNLIQNMT